MSVLETIWSGIAAFGDWRILLAAIIYAAFLSVAMFLVALPSRWNAMSGALSFLLGGSVIQLVLQAVFLGITFTWLAGANAIDPRTVLSVHFTGLVGAAAVGFLLSTILRIVPIVGSFLNDPAIDSLVASVPLALYFGFGSHNLWNNAITFLGNHIGLLIALVLVTKLINVVVAYVATLVTSPPSLKPYQAIIAPALVAMVSLVPVFALINTTLFNARSTISSSSVSEWPPLNDQEQAGIQTLIAKGMSERLTDADIEMYKRIMREYEKRTGIVVSEEQEARQKKLGLFIYQNLAAYRIEMAECVLQTVTTGDVIVSSELKEGQNILLTAGLITEEQKKADLDMLRQLSTNKGSYQSLDGKWYEVTPEYAEKELNQAKMVYDNLTRLLGSI